MSLLSWWKKKKSVEPMISYKASNNKKILIVTSSLPYEIICDEIAESFPPPSGRIWRLIKFGVYSNISPITHYHFKLEDKYENKISK